MIEKLVIHRFRGIREGVLDDVGKVNLLIGPNNSGKSAILELLYLSGVSGRPCHLLMETVDPSAFAATTTLQYDFLEREPLPRLRMRHEESVAAEDKRPAGLTAENSLAFSLKKLPLEYPLRNFILAPFLDELDELPKAFSEQDCQLISLFRLEQQAGIPQAMIPPLFTAQDIRAEQTAWHYLWEEKWVYRWEPKQALDYLAIWAATGTLPNAARILLFDFHTATQHFDKDFSNRAYREIPDWHEKIAAHLGCVFPTLEGATVEITDAPDHQEGKAGYVRRQGQTPLMIDHFGDGARHAFKVLAALITLCESVDKNHPGLFLWEDPELFMHPATLARLLDEVMSLIAEKPIQLFVTTQNIELLAWLVKYLEENPQITPERVRTFRLDLVEGTLKVHPFVGRGIGGWFRFFGDPRFLGEDEMASPLSYLLADKEKT